MSLEAEIDALRSAINRGVRSVTYDGHTVTYRSLDEMSAILRGMERRAGLRPADGGVAYPEFSRDGR